MTVHSLPNTRCTAGLFLVLTSCGLNAQITRDWVASWNGTGDRNDRFTCAAPGGGGSTLVGGSVTNSDRDRDFLVMKVDANGSTVWRQELNGEGNGADEVTDIVLDAAGNVLVTGFSKSANNGTDYRTVKFNAAGTLLWSTAYNNPLANGYDQANAIAVDAAGNVVVTGQSDGDPGSAEFDDYATVKYDANGTELWVARFNGFGNATDRATGLALDGSSNVYVTGRSDNGTNDDYATIKYSASGAVQWVQYGDRGGRDRAVGLALDGGGNVFVTGRSDNGSNDDLWTVKYGPGGTQLWQQPFDFVEDDRATAITIDAANNVYVTGQSDGDATPATDYDFVTVAYSASGAQLWVQRFDGTGSNDDIPVAISAAGGSVYVAGISDADPSAAIQNDAVTRSHNAATGALQWSSTQASPGGLEDEARAVLPAASGCIMLGANSGAAADMNALAVQYGSTGATSWQATANGQGDNNENVRDLVVDATGRIHVAGYTVADRQNRNMAYWQFSPAGALVCNETFNGSSPASPDEAQAIALTGGSAPVLVGFSKNSGESNNITCFRADPATCDTVWMRMVLTAANGSDKVYDMVSDGGDGFLLTGRIDSDPSFAADDDAWTARLNASGTLIWSVSYNSGVGREDRGTYVRAAASGNVYIAGRTWNGSDFDVLLIKYNSGGAQQWVRTWNGGNGDDEPVGLAIDAAENVLIGGSARVAADTTFDLVALKYNAAGDLLWATTHDAGGDDQAAALALDPVGNAVIASTSDVDAGADVDLQLHVVKFTPGGAELWSRSFGNAVVDDHADDVAINALGQVYATGHTNSGTVADPDYDATTVIWDAAGDQLWSDTYAAPADTSDVPARIRLTPTGFVVGGSTAGTATMRDVLLIRYSGSVVGVQETEALSFAAFPSPFTAGFSVSTDHPGHLELFDATGRSVLRVPVRKGTERIAAEQLPAGAFLYRFQGTNGAVRHGRLIHTIH